MCKGFCNVASNTVRQLENRVTYLSDGTKIVWLVNSDPNCRISSNGRFQLIDETEIQELVEGFWVEVQDDSEFEEILND